jgi:hypothetical protein
MSLSALRGEKEGPIAKQWEGEVSFSGMIARNLETHLTRSRRLS